MLHKQLVGVGFVLAVLDVHVELVCERHKAVADVLGKRLVLLQLTQKGSVRD